MGGSKWGTFDYDGKFSTTGHLSVSEFGDEGLAVLKAKAMRIY